MGTRVGTDMTVARDEASSQPVPARLRLVSCGETGSVEAGSVGAQEFRQALAVHAAGVVVVTARPDGVPVGLTATSFSSVSLSPPLVSFYVAQSSTTWPWLQRACHFAVNVLAGDQADVASRFATKDIDRFAHPTKWTPGPEDVPLLDDVSAHLICRRYQTVEVGDHLLVVGLVVATTIAETGRPLLYHRGRFGGFLPH